MIPSVFNSSTGKKLKGFAGRCIPDRKASGSLGGRKAHSKENKAERCHEFDSESARLAALKRWGKSKGS